jgi:hypothetical protein
VKAFWSDTRPNGQPVEAGTVCFITDLEDGTLPIPTYGKSQEEVLEKLALQNAHAQLAIAKKSTRTAPAPAPVPSPAPSKRLNADQVMQATADLTNPAKAPEAVAALFEHQTGLSPSQIILKNFGDMAERWEENNPDFFAHNGNRRMMAAEAAQLAGGLGKVTEGHMDKAFSNLRDREELFEAPQSDHQPSQSFPDESQVQRPERPSRPRFGTSARSTGFRSQTPARTLKYTEMDIRTMPLSKSRALIESGDKDYAECCEYYYGSSAQATA